jgi:hypothetical protein
LLRDELFLQYFAGTDLVKGSSHIDILGFWSRIINNVIVSV